MGTRALNTAKSGFESHLSLSSWEAAFSPVEGVLQARTRHSGDCTNPGLVRLGFQEGRGHTNTPTHDQTWDSRSVQGRLPGGGGDCTELELHGLPPPAGSHMSSRRSGLLPVTSGTCPSRTAEGLWWSRGPPGEGANRWDKMCRGAVLTMPPPRHHRRGAPHPACRTWDHSLT